MKRRGRGEGSIYLKHGRWIGAITIGCDANGRQRRRYVYGRDKTALLEKLDRLKADWRSGVPIDLPNEKVAAFLSRWLEDVARPSVRPSTYRLYRDLIRHIVPRIGGLALTRLTPAHVLSLLAELAREGASGRKLQMVHALLHRALTVAGQCGLVQRNVCDAVPRPRAPRSEIRVWTTEQANEFLKVARDAWDAKLDRFWPLYLLALSTGMRRGELLGLQWEDLDLKDGALSVRRQLADDNGHMVLLEPKTSTARRRIALPPVAVAALRDHRAQMMTEGRHARGERNPFGLLFTDTDGKPLRPSNVLRRSFFPLIKQAGVPRIRFHDLRHTAATLLLQQGVHPKVVQERLGHATISMTLDTYSHVLPSMQREAAEKLDALFTAHR